MLLNDSNKKDGYPRGRIDVTLDVIYLLKKIPSSRRQEKLHQSKRYEPIHNKDNCIIYLFIYYIFQ